MITQFKSWWQRYQKTQPAVYFTSDFQNWAFHWVATYITRYLDERGVTTELTNNPWALQRQIIHFGDRYLYLEGPADTLHASNHLFLTWFHGDPADAQFAALGQKLLQYAPRLQKIVTSNSITAQALITAGIAQDQLAIIPIGIDTHHFQPVTPEKRAAMRSQLGIPPDAVCIGSFQKDGNGWEEGSEPKYIKGPDIFVRVMGELAKAVPSLHVLLTGPARGYVKRELDRLGIAYTHHFLDDYMALAPYYHALDLYLISSRVEGGPKALMESWASGVPVVSTAMGMPNDYIRHGENGLLAPVNDVTALTQAALTLIQQPEKRHTMTQHALQDVKALDWRNVANQYYEMLYAPILER